jgi:hypothetical protein
MAVLLAPNVIMTEVKLVAGEVALDGTNPTPISTGLRTVTAVALTLRGAGAPGDGTSAVTYEISGGIVNVYAWRPTSGTDPTLVASTGTEPVGYVIVGT